MWNNFYATTIWYNFATHNNSVIPCVYFNFYITNAVKYRET